MNGQQSARTTFEHTHNPLFLSMISLRRHWQVACHLKSSRTLMDIKREGVAKKKRIRMAIYLVLTAAGLGLVTWRLMLLKPAAPTVERATVWIDTVKRGPM